MPFKKTAQICCILAFLCASALFGQVSSSVVGVLNDPAKAVVPGAQVELTEQATGAVRTIQSNPSGIFRFDNVPPGTYTVTVKAQGFKSYAQKAIAVVASETRDLGTITLEIGAIVEEISVTAQATPVQTASSEKASSIEGSQLQNIAIKGRDLFGFMALVPGVAMIGTGVETTSPNALTGISINGSNNGSRNGVNMTVDGVTNLDTGGNMTVHYEPNMDSVSEVRVLTSNYQAEYGRASAGTISVVTKGGGREFHGSGWWNKRNEALNANNFFNNRSNTKRPVYRYDVYGFSVGGPVYIPKKFNTQKKHLFFFVSQEYTKQIPNSSPGFSNLPTALERTGDFSQSKDTNGNLLVIKDPTTGQAYAQNKILTPPNAIGLAALNFLPLPNYTDPVASLRYQRNYRNMDFGPYPRRNDMVRIDFYPTSKLNGYFRWVNDRDELTAMSPAMGGSAGVTWPQLLDKSDNTWKTYAEDHPNPGHGYAVGATYVITTSMVNEALYGQSFNTWDFYPLYPGQLDRTKLNLPHWYKDSDIPVDGLWYNLFAPALAFGSTPGNTGSNPAGGTRPYTNYNFIYSASDNVSKTIGTHSLKFGLYYERDEKVQQGGGAYLGTYSFAHDSNWATADGNTGNGYANAYLGNINTYSERPKLIGDVWCTNIEFYAQDNWRVTKRLTLDLGVRFHHNPAWENTNMTSAAFVPSSWSLSAAPRLYYPFYDASGKRFAWDRTGDPNKLNLQVGAMVGSFVPGSGNFANGMEVGGKSSVIPLSMYSLPSLSAVPRIGFALDVFGNGKTAVRGGMGRFFNRAESNPILGTVAVPPLGFTSSLYYSNISTVAGATGANAPASMTTLYGTWPLESATNFSVGIQQSLGFGTVLEASYVGALGRHTYLTRQINPIPMWSQFDPNNYVMKGSTPVLLSDDFFRFYQGVGSVNRGENGTSSNYHGLQTSVRRRFTQNLSFGGAYTFSKTLVTLANSVYFNDRSRNYGIATQNRTHVLVLNYVYDLPKLGTRLGSKALGAVTDNWTVSGIMTFTTGQYFSPSLSVQDLNMTGSAEGARMNALSNPNLSKGDKTFSQAFNTAAFALPTACSATNKTTACFGNAGLNIVQGPGVNNWDLTLAKVIPLGLGEKRQLRFRAEAYNLWNHTQFGGNTPPGGNAINGVAPGVDANATYRGGKNTNLTFGSYNSARPGRVISLSLRFEF